MLADLPPPKLVQDSRGLEALLADLDRQHEIAFDTEADSFYSYHEKVCLIQVTAEDRDYLVDPLAGLDLSPLGRILADPRKLKVFHDGEYDILILKRSYRFEFRNLFDTRVAAATLGSPNPGLATVLRERFQIELDKSMQRSNWADRPLSEKQIRYARLDTRFLLPLMREQREELAARGRERIVEGECRRLERIVPPENAFDPDEYVRLKGARTLGPLERQVLRELFARREQVASDADQPPFRIVNNETLIAIARARPRNLQDLAKIGGFSWRQSRKIGDLVLAAIERAEALGPSSSFPVLKARDGTSDLSEAEIELHERLKTWRKDEAVRVEIDSAYLLNRHVLLRLARERPRDFDELERIEGLLPWQVDAYGNALLDVIERFEKDLAAGAVKPGRRRAPWRE